MNENTIKLPKGLNPDILSQLQKHFTNFSKKGIELPTSGQHHEVVNLDQPILHTIFDDQC